MNLIQIEVNALKLREERAKRDYERAMARPQSAVLGSEHGRAVEARREQYEAIRANRMALEAHLI